MSRREDRQTMNSIMNARMEDLQSRISRFNVQGWVDVRDIAAIVRFCEVRNKIHFGRLADVVRHVSEVYSDMARDALREDFEMSTFQTPSDAVSYLRERGFSMSQFEEGDRRARRARIPQQMEQFAASNSEKEDYEKRLREAREKVESLPTPDWARDLLEESSEDDPSPLLEVSREQVERISEVPDMSISTLLSKKREESESESE